MKSAAEWFALMPDDDDAAWTAWLHEVQRDTAEAQREADVRLLVLAGYESLGTPALFISASLVTDAPEELPTDGTCPDCGLHPSTPHAPGCSTRRKP